MVEFYLEHGQPIYAVPKNWLINKDQYCYWPDFMSDKKRSTASARRQEPEVITWNLHPVAIKYKSCTYPIVINLTY